MQIEMLEYAPPYIKAITESIPNATAYAMFRLYDADPNKYPSLRDRTKEMSLAVTGMSGNTEPTVITATGRELTEYGFDAVGAQFVQRYAIIVG